MSGRNVLVVEDDDDIATLVTRIATDMGFTPTHAMGTKVPEIYRRL